jgi:hypothetical protein
MEIGDNREILRKLVCNIRARNQNIPAEEIERFIEAEISEVRKRFWSKASRRR